MKKQFLALACLLALVAFSQLTVFAADRIRFEVAIDPSLAPQPISVDSANPYEKPRKT